MNYFCMERPSESLAAAGRRLIAAEAATVAATRAARAETARAEAALRRARAAERDAASAAADAAASREELAGAPSASDATEDVKAYFESEVVKSLLMGGEYGLGSELTGAAHHVAVARAAAGDNKDARLIGVTRELCAAKLTERSLLASLAANRRRADAAAAHAADLRAALESAVAAGKIKFYGLCNFGTDDIPAFEAVRQPSSCSFRVRSRFCFRRDGGAFGSSLRWRCRRGQGGGRRPCGARPPPGARAGGRRAGTERQTSLSRYALSPW